MSLLQYEATGSRWRGEPSTIALTAVLLASSPLGMGLLLQAASAHTHTTHSSVRSQNDLPANEDLATLYRQLHPCAHGQRHLGGHVAERQAGEDRRAAHRAQLLHRHAQREAAVQR